MWSTCPPRRWPSKSQRDPGLGPRQPTKDVAEHQFRGGSMPIVLGPRRVIQDVHMVTDVFEHEAFVGHQAQAPERDIQCGAQGLRRPDEKSQLLKRGRLE